MSLRKRLSLVAAAAVAIAVVLAVVVCYWVVRNQLRGQVDDALKAQASAIANGDYHVLTQPLPTIPASAGGPAQYVQVVTSNGQVFPRVGDITLPVDARTVSVAASGAGGYIGDVQLGGDRLRELIFPLSVSVYGQPQTIAVQLARPLNPVDHILSRLRLFLFVLCLGGVALAAALGRIAARRVLAPLAEVTGAAQHIGQTDDLSSRIVVRADDEVGALARNFNTMLDRLEGSRAALDESVKAQRQLVADASHELRTPVTSLRTNIEVLLDGDTLDEEERRRLLADVVEQSEELSTLVADLIDLARGDLPPGAAEEIRLDGIVADSVARARRNAPTIRFEASLAPVIVDGVPERLSRAVNNLLDNTARHSPAGTTVEVAVDPEGVTVRDHGSGVAEADLPYVFDRFYRGANARGRQGSGLGLAIVRQVALQHGGSVSVANAPDGGALFTLRLPGVPIDVDDAAPVSAGPTEGG